MTREPSFDIERAFSDASETNAKALNLAEDAFRDCEEKYRLLLDGIEDYAIFMIDPQGQIVSWNAGAERIKGYKAEEIIGRNFSCFFPQQDIECGRPEEVLRLTAAYGRHEEQGMRVRKDGSRFVASVTFTALRDRNGNLRGFSEFSHDLSESKESEARYRGLLEAAPDAMVVVNSGGEIVLLNVQAENQFGYSRDELIGQKVKNIIPEGFAERFSIAPRPGINQQVLDQPLHTVAPVYRKGDELIGVGVQTPFVAAGQELRITGHHAQRLLEIVRCDIGKML